jgi:hypothetical protein
MTANVEGRLGDLDRVYITETASFKFWFAGSKVTDSDGFPLRVYHGTYRDFDLFDPSHKLHFFTPSQALAKCYANDAYMAMKDDFRGATRIVMPNYLRVLQPFDPRTHSCIDLMLKWGKGNPSEYNYAEWEILEDLDVVANIRALGYDGIWMREGTGYDVIAVYDPRQIRSAIGSTGVWDAMAR